MGTNNIANAGTITGTTITATTGIFRRNLLMAQTNYTPISLYYSTTASATPTAGNLVNGELAINITDGKLFYKDNAGLVQTLASKAGNVNVSSFSGGTTGLTPNTATTGAITLGGTLGVANGGTGLVSLTSGYIPYGNGTSAFSSSSNLNFDGTTLTVGASTAFPLSGAKVAIGNDANSATRLALSNQNAGASALVGIDLEPAGGA
jgi:hypothetical protein